MSIRARTKQNYQVVIEAGSHTFISDEPQGLGGEDTGPSPYDLLLASLASCVVITLHMYAKRKNWALESVEVVLDFSTEPSENKDQRVSVIDKQLSFTGDLTPEQVSRLIEIADRCPVQRTLMGEIKIRSSVKNTIG